MATRESENLQSTSRKKPMEVLVLGLSRTGTSSTRQALKDLGHERVYHTRSVIYDEPDHGDIWVEAFKAKFERGASFGGQDWDRLLGNYTAVTDVPCAIFWKELLEAYPKAKVVLTVRDSTDVWYKSYNDTIDYLTQTAYLKPSLAAQFWSLFLPSYGFDRLMKYQILYTPRGRFEAEGRDWYEQHNASVIAAVPRENLLIFNVKQGWEPLCKFLGKEVPQKPFPRIFETEQYLDTIHKRQKIRGRRAVRRASIFAAIAFAVIGISWGLQLRMKTTRI